MRKHAVGVDVGGTFTDVVLGDGTKCWKTKAYTQPENFGAGVLEGLENVARLLGQPLQAVMRDVVRFGLGTTAVTNVLATKSGRRVGFITTRGFEGHLIAARGKRSFKDGWSQVPWAPVKESCVAGVGERVDRNGAIVRPLLETELVEAARRLVEEEQVEAFAVSFIWSSRNPQHEQAAVEYLKEHFPSLPVFSGISLLPVLREYERSSAAALNAYCADAIDGVSELEAQLKALGMQVPLLLMHTTGGAVTVNDARRNPLGLASSGPAAGSAAAGSLCESLGIDQALTVDMGGTSIDIAVIENGQPMTRQRGEINGIFTAQPSVDVESIGAGGGSIAWADARGALRVGPRSARANPGPVCFGRGGTEPTVTDALLVLGYIDGGLFLGGSVALDLDAATQACEKLGERIGLDASQTAEGVRQIALAEMSRVVRSRLAQGGIRPSETAVVSYGGCGSLFAPALAADLGMGRVVVPPMTSVFSAFGAAVADLRRERVSLVDRMLPLQEESEVERVVAKIATLIEEVRGDLSDDGVEASKQSVSVYGDFRFYRQKWELTLPLEVDEANVSFDTEWAVEAFKKAYAQRYSEAALAAGAPVEFVSLRAIGIGETVRVELEELSAGSSEEPEPLSLRTLYQEGVGRQAVNTYQYESLRPGAQITGPALIDAVDTTIWVPGDSTAAFEASGSLVIAAKSANVVSEAA